eukprot:gene30656-35672_t
MVFSAQSPASRLTMPAVPPAPPTPPIPPPAAPEPATAVYDGIVRRMCGGLPCKDELPDPEVAANQTDWPLWWFAPFFDKTSFGKEAANLVLGMLRSDAVAENDIWVGTSQGDCNYGVDTSMPRVDFDELEAAKKRVDMHKSAIVICHSLPPFWSRPKNKWRTCAPCPPTGYKAAVALQWAVGQGAMAEADSPGGGCQQSSGSFPIESAVNQTTFSITTPNDPLSGEPGLATKGELVFFGSHRSDEAEPARGSLDFWDLEEDSDSWVPEEETDSTAPTDLTTLDFWESEEGAAARKLVVASPP